MIKKMLASLFLAVLLISPLLADQPSDLNLQQVLGKIRINQEKIVDLYAETTTTITSNIVMPASPAGGPGQENKGPQKMIQKGKMWTKGNKSKVEMISPVKQITINDGKCMAIINPETGQKMVQDLSKAKGQGAGVKGQAVPAGRQGEMDLEKAMEYFDLKVTVKQSPVTSKTEYIITGTPKEANKFLGKMEFYVDGEKWVPTKILMYDAKGKVMSQSSIEYQEISGVWTPLKNLSDVNTPMGKMKVEMGFENVKVNKGMSDKEFEIK